MRIDGRFIGRDREVAQLDIVLGDGGDGLRLAMLTGHSGLGKTTLTHVAMQRAVDRGFAVALANGRSGSLSTPFAPWIEALPQLQTTLAASKGERSAADMDRIGIELVALLAGFCAAKPLLLVFDDAHALDESSIALLPYASGVSEQMNLTIMFVEQNDAVDVPASYRVFADGLLARRVVQHLELGPMSDESIRALVCAVLDLKSEDDVPSEIVLRAMGNPWFAKELAESFRRGEDEIPVSIAAAATMRLHGLDDTGQEVAHAVALCPDGAYIGWLDALAGQRPREFVRTMATIKESGLIREDGDLVSIAHPLMRQALLDELSAAMKRVLHQELADVIATAPGSEITTARALGYHLSQAGSTSDAVAQFLRAAEANEIMGQLHEAFADYVRALEAEPRLDERTHLLKRCAYAAMQVGSDAAVDYWAELARLSAARRDDELYAYALYQQYWTSYDGTAMDRLERAAALGPEQFGWSARAAACLKTLSGDYKAAIELDVQAIELARANKDHVLQTLALEKLGMAYAYVGRLKEAIDASRQAVEQATASRLHGWAWIAWNALAENLAENLETERSLVEARASLKYVSDLKLVRFQPVVQASVARALARCGQLDEAREIIDSAVATDMKLASNQYTAMLLWSRAHIAVEIGDTVMAAPAVQQAVEAAEEHGFASWIFESRVAQARCRALSGDLDGAILEIQALNIDEPVSMASLALWLTRIGVTHGSQHALEVASEIRRGIEPGVPLERMMLQEIDVVGAGDCEPLRHVVSAWADAGRRLDAARCRMLIGMMLMRNGRITEAISMFIAVRVAFTELGAQYDEDFVSRALRSLGTRSRARSRTTTVGNLTKRELQIARLVGAGLRNAEIASQLSLAEKTIAAHLSNVYGKVEVRSRVQLAAWLKENDADSFVA